MSLEHRLKQLEKVMFKNTTPFRDWWEVYCSILLDQAYGSISEQEADRRLAELGPEPPLGNGEQLPLVLEMADIFNRVYGSAPAEEALES